MDYKHQQVFPNNKTKTFNLTKSEVKKSKFPKKHNKDL